ncbi:MAG TPA: Gfo/Idh/MocA family oxidoreductase [Bryobacteraceae bacterium]|nr:Gfo/Idh/MocA family oxidoreductase [Bryobacteraceae bacterium]
MNWLVVGIGDITTKRVIPAILAEPRSQLAGLVTRDRAKAGPYQAKVWTNLTEALREPSIDAVYVASPVFLHRPQTIECLRAGKHVLCEKPMALNYQEAAEMQRVAENTRKTLGIAYYRRMYPKVQRARELMASGAIGQPVIAELTSHDWFTTTEDGFRAWIIKPEEAGGGPLYDIASHRIDLLNYLFGAPTRAVGLLSNAVHSTRVEDNATVLIAYDCGVRGVVDVRWHSRVPRDEFRIRGTEGELDLSPLNGPELVTPSGPEHWPAPANLHFPCIENFVTAVLEERTPIASGASSLATSLVTQWVMDSVNSAT